MYTWVVIMCTYDKVSCVHTMVMCTHDKKCFFFNQINGGMPIKIIIMKFTFDTVAFLMRLLNIKVIVLWKRMGVQYVFSIQEHYKCKVNLNHFACNAGVTKLELDCRKIEEQISEIKSLNPLKNSAIWLI